MAKAKAKKKAKPKPTTLVTQRNLSPCPIIAIDPGYTRSAWVEYDHKHGEILNFGLQDNPLVLEMLTQLSDSSGVLDRRVVIEAVASYGMAVGEHVFETVFWSGRFSQAAGGVDRVYRMNVKQALCHSNKATDANLRQVLVDRFGPGKDAAVGTKAKPGPLYGIKADLWQALAVAIAFAHTDCPYRPAQPIDDESNGQDDND